MAFRVLITGNRKFTDYALLRNTLDKLLANRLPDVELLTTGGAGVAMLAASYAVERGLPVVALLPDLDKFPRDAVERRDGELVSLADAAVIVWPQREPGAATTGAGEGDSGARRRRSASAANQVLIGT